MILIIIWLLGVYSIVTDSIVTPSEATNLYLEAVKRCPLAKETRHGYLDIRPGARLFYWFYYADGSVIDAASKPFIIWIQGGPGLAASGIGNFLELGPINADLEARNHTWVKGRNVLFIDHPVGTGFSYAANQTLYATTDKQAATDLFKAIRLFLNKYKEFRKTPTYLFGQSYGGKITARLAFYLHKNIQKKTLEINFKGIGIGGGWVNPKESTLMQPRFLYHMGILDRNTFLNISNTTKKIIHHLQNKDYVKAYEMRYKMFYTYPELLENNLEKIDAPPSNKLLERLHYTMIQHVKPTLSVNQFKSWYYVSGSVYNALSNSTYFPATHFLELLLNNTDLKIIIYNGNLDAVAPLAGASNWVHKLNWYGAKAFAEVKREKISGTGNGFYKELDFLSFWSVFKAGHWVPEDNPTAMEDILQYITRPVENYSLERRLHFENQNISYAQS